MPPDPAPPGHPSFDLFTARRDQVLAPGAMLLGGFARDDAPALLAAIDQIVATAPFRRMTTPGGRTMSVAMTNCGQAGWVSDRAGYRYVPVDPATGRPWPALPPPAPPWPRGRPHRQASPGFNRMPA